MGDRQGILDELDLMQLEEIGMSAIHKMEGQIEKEVKDVAASGEKERDPGAEAAEKMAREAKQAACASADLAGKTVSRSLEWGKELGAKEWEREY